MVLRNPYQAKAYFDDFEPLLSANYLVKWWKSVLHQLHGLSVFEKHLLSVSCHESVYNMPFLSKIPPMSLKATTKRSQNYALVYGSERDGFPSLCPRSQGSLVLVGLCFFWLDVGKAANIWLYVGFPSTDLDTGNSLKCFGWLSPLITVENILPYIKAQTASIFLKPLSTCIFGNWQRQRENGYRTKPFSLDFNVMFLGSSL